MLFRGSLHLLIAGIALALGGENSAVCGGGSGGGFPPPPPAGTTLRVSQDAAIEFVQNTVFDWTVDRSTTPLQTPYVIKNGASAVATFNVAAVKRGTQAPVKSGPIAGQVCVTNMGGVVARSLQIEQVLQGSRDGGFEDVLKQILIFQDQLRAGQTKCYQFRLEGEWNPAREYRVTSSVRILNYNGHEGAPFGAQVSGVVRQQQSQTDVDAAAVLTDSVECPDGFYCEPLMGTRVLEGSAALVHAVTIRNVSAACGMISPLKSHSVLVKATTGETRSASAAVRIFSGKCIQSEDEPDYP
jgi:hypothetical protein